MNRRRLLFAFFFLLSQAFFLPAGAQDIAVSGQVSSRTSGAPLEGVTVTVKGTNTVVVTDENGNFRVNARPGAILVISYVGLAEQEVTVPAEGVVSVWLEEVDALSDLDEVVVVGYGTQRKSNITGAISSVRSKDLENIPNGRVEQALQGRVSGVTIMQNSGQPGSASTIRVRGVTSFGNSSPLWVVDGVVVDGGGIGYLNQSDIESIEVLKDAASSAIYGTRAAAGVILVTTKKGKSGRFVVNYNGFYGVSQPAKKLKLLNAEEYATLLNERSVAAGGNILFADPGSLGKGTDWQEAIFNNSANRYNHEISVSGGNDRSTFYLSAGLQNQQGIVATDISNYDKKNFRLNSTHKISRIFTFGQTLGYTREKNIGLGNTNSEFGGPLSSAINLDPITPLVITDPAQANAAPYSVNPVIRDAAGNPYGISSLVGQEMTNPLAYMQTRLGNYGWSENVVGNAYLEASVIDGLKIRSTVGAKKAYWGGVGFAPVSYLNATNVVSQNNYGKSENRSFNWNIENTITYSKVLGAHDFSVLAGQGAYVENIGGNIATTLYNLPITSYKDASFNFDIPQANRNSSASDFIEHKLTSLFARVNYSFDNRYMFTGIIRRDGSSRFGSNKKYGVFPSFSAGWNIHNESFWSDNNVVNTIKLRGGYGVVGSDELDNFRYLSTISGGNNYTIGNTGVVTTGYAPTTLDNPDLQWEQTASSNIGIDAQLFSNFTFRLDIYSKKTTGMLRQVVIPGYVGVGSSPWANIADMKNSGVELELGYNRQIGDLSLAVNGNLTYLKNEITYVGADTNFIVGGASFQSMGPVTRTQVGYSFNEFWGYKTQGIFQNEAEINAHVDKDGNRIQPNARPGDFRWLDANEDGVISEADRVFLGSNLPKYTYGLTINLAYKGFDFMTFAQGAAGNKIFQGLRRLDIGNSNYDAKALGRWTGEGTSNSYPRLVSNDPNRNFSQMSDFYLEKGDYVRLKVVQLGYSLPQRVLGNSGISRVRVYVTAENLLTITGYTGYDPEVGGGVFGVDKGQYPQARAFMGGLQIQF